MLYTTRLLLQKPDPDPVTGDFLDVSVLNANADRLDAVVSFTVATSGSPVASPFQGQGVLETDTGKVRLWGGSAYKQLLVSGASFDSNIGIGTAPDGNIARKLKLLQTGTNGSLSQVLLEQTGAASGSRALSVKAGGEANERWWVDFDGKMQWGPGTAGADVTLTRSAAGILDVSTGSLTVGGSHPAVPGSFAKYPTPGTYTWTKPAKARWVRVRIVGGGGAGGGSDSPALSQHSKGGGGGGGAYAEKWFDAIDLTATVSITVGARGVGASAANGGVGGTTYFGPTATPFLSASGGLGGINAGSSSATWGANGGAGGATYQGAPDISVDGQAGGQGGGGGTLGWGGVGGTSFMGGGAIGSTIAGTPSSQAGIACAAFGGGGGGGTAGSSGTTAGAANAGGTGGPGLVIVETYY